MTANIFEVVGAIVESQDEFIAAENDNVWEKLLYYPDHFGSSNRKPLVFTRKEFVEVSFKDTDIENIRFIRCNFRKCLFIGAAVTNCEFIDCKFTDTNTSKWRLSGCLIDPSCFARNFDWRSDTNIAIDLYHSLYKNAVDEHQPEYAIESLYMMKKSEKHHLDSQKDRKVIGLHAYFAKKAAHITSDFVSGYGMKTPRIFRFLLIVIGLFSALNYVFQESIFVCDGPLTVIDAVYFTCVTITTLGFGDLTPTSQGGKIFVTIQVLTGIMVISLFLGAVANKTIRTK